MGSLIPRWQTKFPTPSRRVSDLFNLGQFFENFERELEIMGTTYSGLSISSDDVSVFVDAHVPGLTAKDIEVAIDGNNCLWIKGEKKSEEKDKKKKYYRQSQVSFSYCLPLLEEIDQTIEPEATCKDGVMHIVFAKKKEKQTEAKKIKVKE